MNARTTPIQAFALAIPFILVPAISTESTAGFTKIATMSVNPVSVPAGAAAMGLVLNQLGTSRNQIAAMGGSGVATASAFSGTVNLSSTSMSALYAGLTISLPSPTSTLAGQIAHFDIILSDLSTGNAFSILPLFSNVTLIPNGDLQNPATTVILSTTLLDEALLAGVVSDAGGEFQVTTVVTDKSGNTSYDVYYLLSNHSEPAGPILLEQKPISDPDTGELVGASFNYLAGPPIVLGFPPAQGKRLFLMVGSLIGPDEDGSYLGTVQSSDCVTQTAQRCASVLYPAGSAVRIYPPF